MCQMRLTHRMVPPLWSCVVPKETYRNIPGDRRLPTKMVLTILASLTLCGTKIEPSGRVNDLTTPFKSYCADVKAVQSSWKEEFTHNVGKIFVYVVSQQTTGIKE